MENNFDKIQKNAGVNTKLNQFAKLANQMNPISESVRKLIEMQDKLKFVIPDFDIPKIPSFILPKIEPSSIGAEILSFNIISGEISEIS